MYVTVAKCIICMLLYLRASLVVLLHIVHTRTPGLFMYVQCSQVQDALLNINFNFTYYTRLPTKGEILKTTCPFPYIHESQRL